jgi:hypothetical protein
MRLWRPPSATIVEAFGTPGSSSETDRNSITPNTSGG